MLEDSAASQTIPLAIETTRFTNSLVWRLQCTVEFWLGAEAIVFLAECIYVRWLPESHVDYHDAEAH
jgi:hypothetical protein